MRRRTLSVGLLAPPWYSVPSAAYGGTDSAVSELARGLIAAGHDVVLYAAGDSAGVGDRVGDGAVELPHVMHGYESLGGCDVVHDHTLLGPAWALACGYDRVVTTCHGRLDGGLREIYRRYGKRLPVIAISRNQAACAPEITVDRVIHHGVDPDQYPVGRGDGGYLLFLGRMTPDRGVREAVSAARGAGRRLVIAARAREAAEQRYFAEQIAPLLHDGVHFVGEVSGEIKLALMGGAAALLNPTQLAEPFGLVMIEAMACGTPVVGCPNGAAPEIVDEGRTGFLCSESGSLVEAIHQVPELSRAACRATVIERFSTARSVADHIALYRDVLAR